MPKLLLPARSWIARRAAAVVLSAAVPLLVSCGGGEAGGTGVSASSVVSVALSLDSASVRPGGTVTLVATPRDAAGAAVSNRTVTWASTDVNVARVDAGGVATGVNPGVARITATVDGKVAGMVIVVIAPVASVTITAPSASVGTGGTLQLSAALRDAAGNLLFDRQPAWTSSDITIAGITSSGIVTGLRAGTATVTAQSEGIIGTFTVAVVTAATPTITAVSPATLAPGALATISGTNFGSNPTEVTVTVDGVPATVTSASMTSLTVRLGAHPCQVMRNVPVEVRGLGGAAAMNRPLQVSKVRQLATGQVLFLTDSADLACTELPAGGGRYVVNVVNATESGGNFAGLQVRGVGSAPATALTPMATLASGSIASSASPALSPVQTQRASAHLDYLAESRALVRQLGNPRRLARTKARASGASLSLASSMNTMQAGVPLEVGALDTLKLRPLSGCKTFTDVPARVVYVGTRSVILEAADAPLKGTMDADYRRLGEEYDRVMHDILAKNFGSPLAYDAQTDNNGRIIMLFANAVNGMGTNLLGFVSPCDFYPPTLDPVVAASNQAEMFYARVPTREDGTDINGRAGWLRFMRSTLIHEGKHIASMAAKFANDADDLEDAWLEEGTAQVAAELYARTLYPGAGAQFRGNAGYAATIGCELNPTTVSGCADIPRLVVEMYAWLVTYYRSIESRGVMGTDSDVYYGGAWLFARWAADHFGAGNEAAFFTAINQERTRFGLDNMVARSGRSALELQTMFALALYLDDYPGFTAPAGALYTIPSWNTRDVWQGLSVDRPNSFTSPFPLGVRAFSFGTFQTPSASLAGGGSMFIEVSGTQAAPQLLSILGGNGGALGGSSSLRLAIVKVQ